MADTNQDVS